MTHRNVSPRVIYRPFGPEVTLPENTLAAIVFDDTGLERMDSRVIRVGLAPLHGAGLFELWLANGPVRKGRSGLIRYAADAEHLFGVIELDEREYGGIAGAAELGYTTIRNFTRASQHPHLLRVWNHFDAINGGEGDKERYRLFCVGRAAGLDRWLNEAYPAATVIGRRDGDPTLQIYWLASRARGIAVANPRQTNPFEYPRDYGPVPPQFSRAMLTSSDGLLLVSGTASIVGHASRHPGDVRAQLDESLANLTAVLQRGQRELASEGLLKVYLRDERDIKGVQEQLHARLPAGTRYLVLKGDVCRGDLLVEVDGVQGPHT